MNPLKPVARSKPKRESITRAEKREEIQLQMMALLEDGKINSRSDLIDALNEIDKVKVRSDNPNVKHISVGCIGFENNMRMSGGIFERDFDFHKHRPARSQCSSPSMSDYLAEKPKIKRACHRFEEAHADPFGDQDVYLKDIEERLSTAFEYRKTRFERIRAGSRKLAELREQAINVEALAAPPSASKIQEKAEEDVERIAQARRRARERKSKIAQIAGTQQHLSSRCRQAIERIGNHLRAALGKVVDFLKWRASKLAPKTEQSVSKSLEIVGEKSGLDLWLEQLDRTAKRFGRSNEVPSKLELMREFGEILQRRSDIILQVKASLANVPEEHQLKVSNEVAIVIDEEIDRLCTGYPDLFATLSDISTQRDDKTEANRNLHKIQYKPPEPP